MKKTLKIRSIIFSNYTTKATGSTTAFIIAVALVLIWTLTGPAFHFSENWQLVINTGTTVITFLMVFLIQSRRIKTLWPSVKIK